MQTGISSACFYPKQPHESLELLGSHGVKNSEIFLNTFSELKSDYILKLKEIKEYYGMKIPSIHPFTSEFEPFLFFTGYEKRTEDALDFYKAYFEAAQCLGAEYFIFHGDKKQSFSEEGVYAERYLMLYELGKKYGVTVCQENVPRCRCSSIEFISNMKRQLGENVAFVADFKQAIRSGMDIEEMIRTMGKQLVHVHISDSTDECDCLAPSKGNADFDRLLSAILKYASVENIMIELYSKNFKTVDEVVDSLDFLNKKLENLIAENTKI